MFEYERLSNLVRAADVALDGFDLTVVAQALDNIWTKQITLDSTSATEQRATIGLASEAPAPIRIALPMLPQASLLLGTGISGTLVIRFDPTTPKPKFLEAWLEVDATLELDAAFAKPAAVSNNTPTEIPGPYLVSLGTVRLGLDQVFQPTLTLLGKPNLPAFFVAGTGVAVSINGLDFSLKDTDPQKGVSLTGAQIWFPPSWGLPSNLTISNAFVSTTGFSGRIEEDWTKSPSPPGLAVHGFGLSLSKLKLAFEQNRVTESDIRGKLHVPFFDADADVELGLDGDGSVAVALAGLTQVLKWPGVADLAIRQLGLFHEGGDTWIELSGSICPDSATGANWPPVDFKQLRIRNGASGPEVKLPGGWIDVPQQGALRYGPFAFELSRIAFGVDDGPKHWVGFTGGIRLHGSLPAAAATKGLRVILNKTNPAKPQLELACERAELAFEIPDAVRVKGGVSLGHESFEGDIGIQILPLNFGIDGQFVVGRETSTKTHYWGATLNTDLPVGFPILNTGLAIYGLSALAAHQFGPTRDQSLPTWFPDWYKKPKTGVTDLLKWAPHADSFAIAIAATIGTLPDDGFSILLKTMLLVVLPGPIIMLDGSANLLRSRSDAGQLAGSPKQDDFRALAVYDGRAGDMQVGIAAHLDYERSGGNLLTVEGDANAYFNLHDATAWHLWLGTKESPLRGIILKRILGAGADAYWMVDSSRLQTGAGIGIDKHWDFSVKILGKRIGVDVDAGGLARFDASVARKPIEASGDLEAHANLQARAFGRQVVGLVLDGSAHADAPRPANIKLEIKADVELPRPLPRPSVNLSLSWHRPEPPAVPVLLAGSQAVRPRTADVVDLPVDPVFDSDGDGFYDGEIAKPPQVPVIELDARPRIAFVRPVSDKANCGGAQGLKEPAGGFIFEHELTQLQLRKSGQVVSGFAMRWLAIPGLAPTQALEAWASSPLPGGQSAADGGISDLQNLRDRRPDEPCGPLARRLDVTFDASAVGTTFNNGDNIDGLTLLDARRTPPLRVEVADRFWRDPDDASAHIHVLRGFFASNGDPPAVLRLPWRARRIRLVLAGGSETFVWIAESASRRQVFRATRSFGVVVVDIPGQNLEAIVLTGAEVDLMRIQAFEATPEEEAWIRTREVEAQLRLARDAASLASPTPLLDPYSDYELRVGTVARRVAPDGQKEEFPNASQMQVVRFKTAGAPQDLTPYLAADGRIPAPGEKPVYRSDDFRAGFAVDYVQRMYTGKDALSIVVTDDNGAPAKCEDGSVATLVVNYTDTDRSALTPQEQRWVAIVNESNCGAFSITPKRKAQDLSAGAPGLRLAPSRRHSVACVSNAKSVSAWDFSTSRYVSFVHHIADHRERTFSASAKSLEVQTALTVASATTDEDAAVDSLLRAWFSSQGYRPLPEHLEGTSLFSDGQPFAFLLESPEPLDWRRMDIVFDHSPNRVDSALSPDAPVKIHRAAIDPPGRDAAAHFWEEWIEIVMLADQDLVGWQLQHTTNPGTRRARWRTYYTFPAGMLREGVRVRVHSGSRIEASGRPHQYADEEAMLDHRYVVQPGQPESWWLNNTGDIVRLVTANGALIHELTLVPYASGPAARRFSTRDGTRNVFILTALLSGSYRATLTYHREKQNLPTKSRNGYIGDETAEVRFRV